MSFRLVRPVTIAATLVVAAGLAGCHRTADDPTAVTADEQVQLNDAAAALDANAPSANAEMPDASANADTPDASANADGPDTPDDNS